MSDSGAVVAIIPARGGSKGIIRKNIRNLAGKPMIAWTIEIAQSLSKVDRVIVSTEDKEIADIASSWGAEIPFLRPVSLAEDHSSTESVLMHALHWLENDSKCSCKIVFYLQVDCPYRSKKILEEVLEIACSDDSIDTVFTARPEYKNFWKIDNNEFRALDHRGHTPRQIKEHIFMEDTGTACATRSQIIRNGQRIGKNVHIVAHDVPGQFIEFHSEFDLALGNLLANNFNVFPNQQ